MKQITNKDYYPVYSGDGRISQILLSYNMKLFPTFTLGNLRVVKNYYENIFKAFGNNVTYYILLLADEADLDWAHEQILAEEYWEAYAINKDKVKFVKRQINYLRFYKDVFRDFQQSSRSSNDFPLPTYIQDVLNVCSNRYNETTLIRSLYTKRESGNDSENVVAAIDLHIAEEMALKFPEMTVRPTEIFIEGGNVLAGRRRGKDFLLVADSVADDNAWLYDKKTKEEIKAAVAEELTKMFCAEDIIWINTAPFLNNEFEKLLFHIDLYITICGPVENGQLLVLVACIDDTNSMISPAAGKDKLKDALDDTAAYLAGLGFLVERIILPMVNKRDDMSSSAVFSYNNCLVENYIKHGERIMKIYLPSYQDVPIYTEYIDAKYLQVPEPILENKTGANIQPNTGLLSKSFELRYAKLIAHLTEEDAIPDFAAIEKKLKKDLAKHFKRKGSIKFIRSHFMVDERDNHASLHCLTKVLKRDNL